MSQTPEPTDPAAVRAADPVFALHRGGKMEIASTVALDGRDDLSMAYTPGVARVCMAIHDDPSLAFKLTIKQNTVAVVARSVEAKVVEEADEASAAAAAEVEAGAREAAAESLDVVDDATIDGQDAVEAPVDDVDDLSPDDTTEE